MRVSIRYGFTFLCMPKCASTSIERALRPYCELVTQGGNVPGTRLKHTNLRNYKKFLEPFINTIASEPLETVCLMREPIDWLHSWYRYRKRDEIADTPRSTRGISFDQFCEAYMEGKVKGLGSQYRFITTEDGEIGVDKIFRYEELDKLKQYFEEKIGKEIEFPVMNVSPKEERLLSPEVEAKLKEFLKKEYEIYEKL